MDARDFLHRELRHEEHGGQIAPDNACAPSISGMDATGEECLQTAEEQAHGETPEDAVFEIHLVHPDNLLASAARGLPLLEQEVTNRYRDNFSYAYE